MKILDRRKSAGYMTNWAARLFAKAIDRRLHEVGVSSGHLPVFFALADGTPRPQRALAAAAAVEQPTMAATLARMERDRLIQRKPDPDDARSALISLTPLAAKKLAAIQGAVASVNAAAMAGLPAADQERFLQTLGRVIDNLDAALAEE